MTTITIPQDLANELLDLAGITPIVTEVADGRGGWVASDAHGSAASEVTYSVGGEAGFPLDEALVLALHFIADHAQI